MKKQIYLSLSLASALVAPDLFASASDMGEEGENAHHNPAFLRAHYKLDLVPSDPASVARLERKGQKLKAHRDELKASAPAVPMRMMAAASVPAAPAKPNFVDLRSTCSPIQDQKNLGACALHALEGAIEQASVRKTGSYVNFSRLFNYYNARAHMGESERDERAYLTQDSGLTITDAAASVLYGLLPESFLPYTDDTVTFTKQPLPSKYREALKWLNTTGISFVKVSPTKAAIDQELQNGKTVMFGMALHDSFQSESVARTGMVPLPKPSEGVIGGHAMLIVGVDDRAGSKTNGCYIVRNSWSTSWGEQGYCYIPQSMLLQPDVTYDLWRISDVVNIQKVDAAAQKAQTRILKGKAVPVSVVPKEVIEEASAKKMKRAFSLTLAKRMGSGRVDASSSS